MFLLLYDLTALLVTNPHSSQQERVMLKGETWMVEKAFNVQIVNDTCVLPLSFPVRRTSSLRSPGRSKCITPELPEGSATKRQNRDVLG